MAQILGSEKNTFIHCTRIPWTQFKFRKDKYFGDQGFTDCSKYNKFSLAVESMLYITDFDGTLLSTPVSNPGISASNICLFLNNMAVAILEKEVYDD